MDKNRIRGVVDQGEWASCREALVVKEKLRRSGGCAAKDRALTWGDLALRLKGRRPQGRKREVSSGRSNRSSGAGKFTLAPRDYPGWALLLVRAATCRA
jgi:hypothetical protein